MKHHQHAIGWRAANRMDESLAASIVALTICNAIVIGLTCWIVFSVRK